MVEIRKHGLVQLNKLLGVAPSPGNRETESRSWTCYAATTTFDRQYLLVFRAMLAMLTKPCFISQRRFCFVSGMTHTKLLVAGYIAMTAMNAVVFFPSNLIFDGSKV